MLSGIATCLKKSAYICEREINNQKKSRKDSFYIFINSIELQGSYPSTENRQSFKETRISTRRSSAPQCGLNRLGLLVSMALGGATVESLYELIQPIMVHIGQLIKQEMLRQERTPAWLARHINCQRTNIYYIFSQSSINTDQLIAISRALKKNFFEYYTDAECGVK